MNHLKCSIPPPDIGGLYFFQNKSKQAVEFSSFPISIPFHEPQDNVRMAWQYAAFSIKLSQKLKKNVPWRVLV
jgi:hypothetical protein